MSKAEILDALPRLTPAERQEIRRRLIELDGDGWLVEEEPLTGAEKALLEARLAAYEKDPGRRQFLGGNRGPHPVIAKSRRVHIVDGMNLLDRITVNPDVMTGKPCVRGLRLTVATVLGLLAAGAGRDEILRSYPFLEPADIDACLAYAAWRTQEYEAPLAPVA